MTAKILVTDATTLMNIIDATPASIQIIGQDGRYLDCNAATYTMFRARDSEDIIGKPPSILSPEKQSDGRDSMEGAAFYIKKALGGEDVSFEWEHMRLDGTVFPCKVTLKRIDYVGTPCLMATIVDITEVVALRKRSEFIIAHAPSPIVDVNPDLSIQYANPAFAALTDTPSEQLCRMKISDFDVRNRVGGSLTEALEKKSTVHGELDAHVKSGVRHLQYYYTPFFDQEGNLLSIFAYYFDKTAEISAVREIIHLTERSQAGDLDARVDPAPYSGELRILMEGINGTLDAIIGPLNVAAEYVDRIAKGDLPPRITDQYNGDFNEIKNNLNNCIDSLNRLLKDTTQMYEYHTAGDMDASIDLTPYQGFYRDITAGYNNAVSLHVGSVLKILTILSSYSAGDFNPVLEQLPGKQALANEKLDQLRSHILALIADCNLLIRAAVEGRLEVRADATKHQGDYRKIIEGINAILDAVVRPLQDAGAVLDRMAVNDHTRGMDESKYQGEYVKLASSINAVRTRVNHIAGSIEKISYGDLSELEEYRKIGRRSEQDRVVPGFIKAIESLQALSADMNMLVEAASAGNYAVRADVSRHEGEYRKIIEGINATVGTIADKVIWYESILDAVPMAITVTDLN
ncbi:PAS domain-containing protein, partial [Methanospirillum sp.]|uniref:PAS domain-containing protein n=1 Tax=Methanospirillum sp. TaxID=45200 RepID=UPI002CCEA1F7